MLKKFDTQLLLRFPLLWNTRFPYMMIVGILFHILAFLAGFWFNDFGKDLYHKEVYFYKNRDLTALGIGITGSVILLVWFLFYIRNNGFKSFYPKKKDGLFKEWLIVLGILVFFSMAFFSVNYGSRYAARTVFSTEKLNRNAEITYKGRLLMLNDEYNKERQPESSYIDPVDSVYHTIDSEFFKYKDKEYPWKSMIANQDRETFYYDNKLDSVYTDEVRQLFYKNDSVRLRKILDQYSDLLKEHHLETNVTPALWFKYFYNKEFVSDVFIGDRRGNAYDLPEYPHDKKGLYADSYILKEYYGNLIIARDVKVLDDDVFLALLYLAVALSMVVITFRVSSLLQWFISVVTFILLIIINTALLGFISDRVVGFQIFLIALLAELIVFLLLALMSRYRKNLSSIALNVIILGFTFIIPSVIAVFRNAFWSMRSHQFGFYTESESYTLDRFFSDAAAGNLILTGIVMLLLLRWVRSRKALPGN